VITKGNNAKVIRPNVLERHKEGYIEIQ